MKNLIVIGIAVAAVYYFVFNSSNGAFNEDGNPTTLVFTQNNCGTWCDKGVSDLERRKIPFAEMPLDNNKENIARYKDLGGTALPFFVMGNKKYSGYNKYWVATTVAQAFGDKYLTVREKRNFRNHFYDDGSPLIYVYGASWCPYCKKLREELTRRDIDYVEIDVEKTSNPQLLANTMGINGYPLVYVGYVRVKGGADLVSNILDAVDIAENRTL
ncbi:hypothetical protein MNBD_GAMMA23-1091 [hydrothermal vent metagenome]|uniref:Glutaredoxin domain-containing protein n=1 Tax=hydrothermal vent metagenome TaxID=652676 RepID=A0A3B0ZKF9_9ZZZZ